MPTRVVQETAAAVAPQSDQPLMSAAAETQQLQQYQAPTLKLSFGGVDFSLLPKSNPDGSVTFETMGPNEAILSLHNFTGKLRVTCNFPSNLVEEATSPSPDKQQQQEQHAKKRQSPIQQQISSWAQKKKANSPQAGGNEPFDQAQEAPTPTVTNGKKKRCSSVEEVVTANRSSPLPYHSPLKRSRTSKTTTAITEGNNNKSLSQKLPHSPISLGQKSQSAIDCSQTQPSEATASSNHEEDQEMHDASEGREETTSKNKDTVQDIMKRNQNASSSEEEDIEEEEDDDEESVATNKADEMEDDPEETQLSNHGTDNPILRPSPSKDVVFAPAPVPIASKPKYKSPCPRWGHTMTMVDHNRALVYGGQAFDPDTGKPVTLADVHVFDVEKQKWFQPVQSEATQKWPRQWHSATFLPERQLLICFGGEAANPKTGRVTTSDRNNTMVLDTEIMLWYPPSVSGDIPSGRSGHTATLLPSSSNNELVVFGGVKGSKWLNSVSVLDTTRWVWNSPKIQGVAPKARSYHSTVAVQANIIGNDFEEDEIDNKDASVKIQSKIVIFGGNDAMSSFNTVHVLEKTEGTTTTWRWFHPFVTGKPPKARTGHSATLMEDGKTICIYGGWDPSAEDEENTENKNPAQDDNEIIFNDCYLLDTEKWTWREGPAPVFGGHSLDPSQGEDGGARRVGHSAILNTTNKDVNEVLVFGGRVPEDRFTGDFQTFTIA